MSSRIQQEILERTQEFFCGIPDVLVILPQNDTTEKTFGFRGLRNPVFLMAIKNLFRDS